MQYAGCMPVKVQCIVCETKKEVSPYRKDSFRFCSYRCAGEWRRVNYQGSSNPSWQGIDRSKKCQFCGIVFSWDGKQAASVFKSRKFCSRRCSDKGGFRYSGENHPNYRKDARRRNRGGSHHKWVNAVISRDNATCQKCGAKGIELHAHHIKPYKDYPELRFDIDNGITLCCLCHWAEHAAQNDNGVNSGEPLTGKAEGNPEPSPSGNIREGVTTRGRAYRRWEGHCAYCGEFLSKRLSGVIGKSFVACSYTCSSKYKWYLRGSKAVKPPRAPHP